MAHQMEQHLPPDVPETRSGVINGMHSLFWSIGLPQANYFAIRRINLYWYTVARGQEYNDTTIWSLECNGDTHVVVLNRTSLQLHFLHHDIEELEDEISLIMSVWKNTPKSLYGCRAYINASRCAQFLAEWRLSLNLPDTLKARAYLGHLPSTCRMDPLDNRDTRRRELIAVRRYLRKGARALGWENWSQITVTQSMVSETVSYDNFPPFIIIGIHNPRNHLDMVRRRGTNIVLWRDERMNLAISESPRHEVNIISQPRGKLDGIYSIPVPEREVNWISWEEAERMRG